MTEQQFARGAELKGLIQAAENSVDTLQETYKNIDPDTKVVVKFTQAQTSINVSGGIPAEFVLPFIKAVEEYEQNRLSKLITEFENL